MNKQTCPNPEKISTLIFEKCSKGSGATVQHIKSCRSCRSLYEKTLKQEMNKALDETQALLNNAEQDFAFNKIQYEFGQIWRVENPGSPPRLSVLTVCGDYANVSQRTFVRVSPISEIPAAKFKGDNEIVAQSKDSPLKMPFVIEHWNDRPVNKKQLKKCFGVISAPLQKKLREAFYATESKSSFSESVFLYRQSRIFDSQGLSQPLFQEILAEPPSITGEWVFIMNKAGERVVITWNQGPDQKPEEDLGNEFPLPPPPPAQEIPVSKHDSRKPKNKEFEKLFETIETQLKKEKKQLEKKNIVLLIRRNGEGFRIKKIEGKHLSEMFFYSGKKLILRIPFDEKGNLDCFSKNLQPVEWRKIDKFGFR